jgi:hypothetical protein
MSVERDPYSIVCDGLLRLHNLKTLGKERSPEADAIRDESEPLWRELSDCDKQILSGFSKALNGQG